MFQRPSMPTWPQAPSSPPLGLALLVLSEPSPSPLIASFGPLGKHVAQQWIVAILVNVVYAHVALQVVGTRIFMLSIGAEGAHVARRVVHQAVTYHFVLPLEALAAFGARAARHGAEVWPLL
jgi:hypothetical protein